MQYEDHGRTLFFVLAHTKGASAGDTSEASSSSACGVDNAPVGVTVGLVKSRAAGDDCPVVVVPKDQQGIRELLFGDKNSWIPVVMPFLGRLITSSHPLLLKAHNETGFMPNFTEITGKLRKLDKASPFCLRVFH